MKNGNLPKIHNSYFDDNKIPLQAWTKIMKNSHLTKIHNSYFDDNKSKNTLESWTKNCEKYQF